MEYWQQLLESILQWDTQLLIDINSHHNNYFDHLMYWFSDTLIWIPIYVSMLIVLVKHKKNETILCAIAITLCVVFADQFASGFCKSFFERLRPSQDPSLEGIVHLVNNYRSGAYGFISSHAANTFAISLLMTLIFRNVWFSITIFSWAVLNSYTRMYLGVNYPLDIFFGALAGLAAGLISYYIYLGLKRLMPQLVYQSPPVRGYSNKKNYIPTSDFKMFFVAYLMTIFISANVANLTW